MTDESLILQLKSGSHQAFEIIYKKYWQILYHHSLLMLQDKEEAQDIVQEIFSAIWNKRDTIQISESLSAYLYGATRNRVLNKLKKDSVITKYMNRQYLDMDTRSLIPDNILIQKELARQIERCIEGLPKRTREIFLLSRGKQLSHKEIAELLGISHTTVKKQVSNALEAIRKHVKFVLLLF